MRSRDGKRKATIAGADVIVAPLDGGATATLHEECAPAACGDVVAVAWSPSGDELATVRAGARSEILVWNVKGTAITARLPFRKLATPLKRGQLAWNDEGLVIAVVGGDYDATAFAWDAAARASSAPPRDLDTGRGGSITVDPFGRFLAHVTTSGKPRKPSPTPNGGDGARVEVTGGTIKPLSAKPPATELVWTPGGAARSSGPIVAAWQRDGSQAMWPEEVRGGDADVTFLRVADGSLVTARGPSPSAAVISADGARAATVRDRLLSVWSVTEHKIDFDEQLPDGRVSRAAFSADGKHVSVAYDDHLEVRGVERRGVELFWAGVSSSAWSPHDAVLAATVASGRVQVRDVASRSMLFETNESAVVVDGSFSPDGAWLATASTGKVSLWKTDTWKVEQELPSDGASDIVWSPGGDALLIVAGNKLAVWEVGRGGPRATLTLPGRPLRVIWPGSKDAAEVVVALGTGDVATYDVESGKVVRTLAKSGANPAAVATISPDGRFLISGPRTLRRVRDGAELTFGRGAVIASTGVFDGDPAILATHVYRLGIDRLEGPLIPAADLADQLRHSGLLRDFLDGKPIDAPRIKPPAAAAPTR